MQGEYNPDQTYACVTLELMHTQVVIKLKLNGLLWSNTIEIKPPKKLTA